MLSSEDDTTGHAMLKPMFQFNQDGRTEQTKYSSEIQKFTTSEAESIIL
jgi:hypothetical protein